MCVWCVCIYIYIYIYIYICTSRIGSSEICVCVRVCLTHCVCMTLAFLWACISVPYYVECCFWDSVTVCINNWTHVWDKYVFEASMCILLFTYFTYKNRLKIFSMISGATYLYHNIYIYIHTQTYVYIYINASWVSMCVMLITSYPFCIRTQHAHNRIGSCPQCSSTHNMHTAGLGAAYNAQTHPSRARKEGDLYINIRWQQVHCKREFLWEHHQFVVCRHRPTSVHISRPCGHAWWGWCPQSWLQGSKHSCQRRWWQSHQGAGTQWWGRSCTSAHNEGAYRSSVGVGCQGVQWGGIQV